MFGVGYQCIKQCNYMGILQHMMQRNYFATIEMPIICFYAANPIWAASCMENGKMMSNKETKRQDSHYLP